MNFQGCIYEQQIKVLVFANSTLTSLILLIINFLFKIDAMQEW